MLVFKYGILIRFRQQDSGIEWRIALIDENVEEHECIAAPSEIFDFSPTLGACVKVGFESEAHDGPTIVKRCESYEWIRDVKVIESTVVIFAIAHFSRNCLQQSVRRRNDQDKNAYYFIENEHTDFKRISIQKKVVDDELAHRSKLQKPNEPFVYRVGICWDPILFDNGLKVPWRHYQDFPIVPIFELYWREPTLPYLSESMVYGVLEGITIAKSSDGALIWSPTMGCAVLSSATTAQLPPLGSVNIHLIKRCIADEAFGFPCCYELLPQVINHEWNGLKLIIDQVNGSVYLEVSCELVSSLEQGNNKMCMNVPHIGKVSNGLQPYWNQLVIGEKYTFRIEFQRTECSYEPVIVDLQLAQDYTVACRIVYISPKLKKYFAVLDSQSYDFQQNKFKIDFVAIPFRTFYCSLGTQLENKQLLLNRFHVSIRVTNERHAVVDAVNVRGMDLYPKDGLYRVVLGRTWLRTTVVMQKLNAEGQIDLLCPVLAQQITDFSRLTIRMLDRQRFAVQAQFALTPGNTPMFLVRHVAVALMALPKLTDAVIAGLPLLRDVFASLFPQTQSQTSEPVRSPPRQTREVLNDCNSIVDSSVDEDRSESPSTFIPTENGLQILPTNDSVGPRFTEDVHTILEESVMTIPHASHSSNEDQEEREWNGRVGGTETISPNSSLQGEIITESFFETASNVSSRSYARPSSEMSLSKSSGSEAETVINCQSQSLFGYNINYSRSPGSRALSGFGPPTFVPRTKSIRTRPLKIGIRKLKNSSDDNDILYDVVYRHTEYRTMIIENQKLAVNSWMRRPNGTVLSTKRREVTVYGIEKSDCTESHRRGRCPFQHLVRLLTTCQDMLLMDRTIVMPVGGLFPNLPKGFTLGKPYSATHFVFTPDKMVRIGGYAKDVGSRGLAALPQDEREGPRMETMSDNGGHEWLRIETRASRPTTPFVESNVFELWDGIDHPGWIIVEKTPSLMKVLETPNPDAYTQDQYKFMIEPLAGGPMEFSVLKDGEDSDDHIIMWRMIIEFSDTVSYPVLYNRVKVHVEHTGPRDTRRPTPEEARKEIENYGMFKTMAINQQLAQERVDRLRALGDPRVKMFDGPKLAPEMELRKVDIVERREKLLSTMRTLLKELPRLQSKGYFVNLEKNELMKMIDQYNEMDDDNHLHTFKKRNRALVLGCNFMTDILVAKAVYKDMNNDRDVKDVLMIMSDCLGLNSTYIKKSEDAKRMLQYMFKNKLHSYF